MSYQDFDVIKITRDEKLVDYTDYRLVKLTQRDVDEYRSECYWQCPDCGYKIPYKHSLLITGKYYIHEMRCPDETYSGRSFKECKCKMILIREDDKGFDSVYFNELFARYQERIVWESKKSFAVDSPDEVYSTLTYAFLKIVLQFARDPNFTSKSDKWFSSFFWRSAQNKIADLQKTNTYNKRCPTVKCAICGKNIGQITTRHLSMPGHEVLLEEIFASYGLSVLYDSGEIKYYKGYQNKESKIRNRSIFIGKSIFYRKKDNEKRRIFESECLEFYSRMFPNALFKNNVSSINITVGEDDGTELIELISESIFGEVESPTCGLEIDSSISQLTEITMQELEDELEDFLKVDLGWEELKKIINKVLLTKGTFEDDSENKKIDGIFDEVQVGFTEALLGFIRGNHNCRICMGVSVDDSALALV